MNPESHWLDGSEKSGCADIRIPGPVTPRVPRELLTSDDIYDLASMISDLDASGAQITGTIRFKGHSIALAYDSTTNRHYVGI